MKKVALVFLLAVIAPSLVLAWLAVRSVRDQAYVADQQRTLLYQSLAESKASAIAQHLDAVQRTFGYQVESLFKTNAPRDAAAHFDADVRASWPLAEIGFVVSLDGQVIEPSLFAGSQARKFRLENDRFLCCAETVEVYWNSPKGPINLAKLDQKEAAAKSDSPYSKLAAGESNFCQLIGDAKDGLFARFLQDKLHVMFWHRAEADPQLLFGAQVKLGLLVDQLRDYMQLGLDLQEEICLALLDDGGNPVALSHPGFRPGRQVTLGRGHSPGHRGRPNTARNLVDFPTAEDGNALTADIKAKVLPDWKHPFVASKVCEALPHWEVAIYLLDPAKAGRAAATLRFTLGLCIGLLVLAIAVGSWLIVADLRRQLTLARQKTGFVSNVSHELKTPLTSIRLFSEMLAQDTVQDESKRRHFLSIITTETARLTRLINNVLDFSRLERGEKKYHFEPFDVVALVRETVESYRPQLESGGFILKLQLSPDPAEITGDRDALAQVLVNLLSNAEKYSGERKEIEVRCETRAGGVEVKVLDRGWAVPAGCEERIFEQFYRAHDSLASGIQGCGLGLTLARQIARAHGGEVTYESRPEGGSCFTLKLPATP